MQPPVRGFFKAVDVLGFASRLVVLAGLLLIALAVGSLTAALPHAFVEAQHGLDRHAGQLLLGLLERFAPQLGNFL